jgi:hypothetical protein
MTTAEMITAFEVNYDIVNLEGPGYEESEELVLLNQAQILEVMKEIEKRNWTILSNLLVNEQGTLAAGLNYNYTKLFTPAQEYIGYISSKTKITRSTYRIITPAEWVENIYITKEVSGKYLTNTLNFQILLQPRVFEDTLKKITVIYDRHTTVAGANDFYLEYIRRPIDIETGVNCEVNEILHERIVNTAVNLAKKVFNPNESGGSVQTDMMINKTV